MYILTGFILYFILHHISCGIRFFVLRNRIQDTNWFPTDKDFGCSDKSRVVSLRSAALRRENTQDNDDDPTALNPFHYLTWGPHCSVWIIWVQFNACVWSLLTWMYSISSAAIGLLRYLAGKSWIEASVSGVPGIRGKATWGLDSEGGAGAGGELPALCGGKFTADAFNASWAKRKRGQNNVCESTQKEPGRR